MSSSYTWYKTFSAPLNLNKFNCQKTKLINYHLVHPIYYHLFMNFHICLILKCAHILSLLSWVCVSHVE